MGQGRIERGERCGEGWSFHAAPHHARGGQKVRARRRRRRRLAQEPGELVRHARVLECHPGGGLGRPAGRRGLHGETQPGGIAHRTNHSAGILQKGIVPNDPDASLGKVRDSPVGIDEFSGVWTRQAVRHRVDADVPAGEVVGQRPGLHLGKRSRVGVPLTPCRDEIHLPPVRQAQGRGAELLVRHHHGAQRSPHPAGNGNGVALHDQIDVRAVGQIEQRVPDEPAHHADGNVEQPQSRHQRAGLRHTQGHAPDRPVVPARRTG